MSAKTAPRIASLCGIAPIVRMWKLAYYRWALREIDPMHEDVSLIVHRINELEAV